jgi:drug/metabolite transporter (DMT)-like permease
MYGGAQLARTRACSLQPAAPVSAVSNLGVVFTYLLAIPLFGDLPTPWQIGGGAPSSRPPRSSPPNNGGADTA